jgi:phytoene dehydrogenase-like protein
MHIWIRDRLLSQNGGHARLPFDDILERRTTDVRASEYDEIETADVAVVGGGIAGLTAAAVLARAGRSVVLFERSSRAGGRAGTADENGFKLNIGPHALYIGGEGSRVLGDLGIVLSGGKPDASGAHLVRGGRAFPFPNRALALLTTGALSLFERVESARVLGSLARIDPAEQEGTTAREWIERTARRKGTRDLLAALLRVSSYTADLDRYDAGAAIAQLQLALGRGVRYLDGGWQSLVDALRAEAERHGATIVTGERVTRVEPDGPRHVVRLASGRTVTTAATVLALGPREAARLVELADAPLGAWAEDATPIHAACLDLTLRRLPRPSEWFALGLDRPLYLSAHSRWARLAPGDGAVVHAMMYQPAEGAAHEVRAELEALVDTIQPGWRKYLVSSRFMPSILVSNAIASVATRGTTRRPGPAVPGAGGLFVAGDWVGPYGMLADASLASAHRAALLALDHLSSASVILSTSAGAVAHGT